MAEFDTALEACVDHELSTARVPTARIVRAATVQPTAAMRSPAGRAFGAVSVYLERVEGSGTVPTLTWELRARHSGNTRSELIDGGSGTLSKFTDWTKEGSILHASGHFALGYELWMCASGSGVSIPCNVRFVFAGPSCGPYSVHNGTLV